KLLKSGAASALSVCCEVAYITLSSSGVNHFFQRFLRRKFLPNLPVDAVSVSRCAVSMEAHYREFFRADKR
ncbi:hypothetical protein, partial [Pantoea eucrina]